MTVVTKYQEDRIDLHCHIKFIRTDFPFGFLRLCTVKPHRLRFEHRELLRKVNEVVVGG